MRTIKEDKVVITETVINNENGNVVETKKTIICSVCGQPNPVTAYQCKMCGNYLETEGEE